MTDRQLVERLADVWASMFVLGAELSDAEWDAPSMLPGWSVRDVYAHIVHTEELLLGRDVPDHQAPPGDHVRNEIGRFLENGVDFYRTWSGPDLLARFAEVTDERLAFLRGLTDEGFRASAPFVVGDGTVGGALPFRIVDCWIHEQDVRLALNRAGGWDSDVAPFVLDRLFIGMGKVVGKLAQAPDGAVVVFRIGSDGHALEVVAGRAQPVDETTAPSVILVMDPATFVALAAGRGDAEANRAAVTIEGDHDLGTRVLEHMNVMF